jgi:hypothetical protein
MWRDAVANEFLPRWQAIVNDKVATALIIPLLELVHTLSRIVLRTGEHCVGVGLNQKVPFWYHTSMNENILGGSAITALTPGRPDFGANTAGASPAAAS